MGVVSHPSQDRGSGGGSRLVALGGSGGLGWGFSSQLAPPVPRGPVSQLACGLHTAVALPGFT